MIISRNKKNGDSPIFITLSLCPLPSKERGIDKAIGDFSSRVRGIDMANSGF
jgi:hypothetical protein